MREGGSDRLLSDAILLDIGEGVGALVIYTKPTLGGRTIEVSRTEGVSHRIHSEVRERLLNGQPVHAAVFAALPQGPYRIWTDDPQLLTAVTIRSGQVAEVDWR